MANGKRRGIQFDNPNEQELFHAKESWVPLIIGTIPFIIVGIAALAIANTMFNNTQVGLILLAVCLAAAILTRIPRIIANLDTDVVVTDKRLYARTGIIDIKDQVCDLTNVSDVTVDPTIFGRMFDYADVRIQTFAGDQDFVLRGIAHAYKMRQSIHQGMDALRGNAQPRRGMR
ncbi:MAG: PH domain-containing protein [Coriobacteriales bacterium]|nr:PH domain-containing protein [Coriobacteriales bacterium]